MQYYDRKPWVFFMLILLMIISLPSYAYKLILSTPALQYVYYTNSGINFPDKFNSGGPTLDIIPDDPNQDSIIEGTTVPCVSCNDPPSATFIARINFLAKTCSINWKQDTGWQSACQVEDREEGTQASLQISRLPLTHKR